MAVGRVGRPVPIIVASGNGAAALSVGVSVLAGGGSAADAVEACARVVESDPAEQSVGRGGLPNALGEVELDASLMDGTTLSAGAVAALRGFLHPISIARAVMERLPHVLLVGAGAEQFAVEIGAERASLLTDASRHAWWTRLRAIGENPQSVRQPGRLTAVVRDALRADYGTVNFIAIDQRGDMASAVSTSGWAYKYPGRVGDSPLIGSGNYCDSRHGAATCMGFGELAIRSGTARVAVDRLAHGALPTAVAIAAVADASSLAAKPFDVLVLAADGTHAGASNQPGQTYAYRCVESADTVVVPRVLVAAPTTALQPRAPLVAAEDRR